MSDAQTAFTVRAAAGLLPASARESVVADLVEESTSLAANLRASWVRSHVLHIAACYHLACYRRCSELWRIGCLFAAAFALLLVVPHAAAQLAAGRELFRDPVTQGVILMLESGRHISAAAVGLLIGRATLLAAHQGLARWHTLFFALLVVVARDGWPSAAPAVALLLGFARLADGNRRAAEAAPVLTATHP